MFKKRSAASLKRAKARIASRSAKRGEVGDGGKGGAPAGDVDDRVPKKEEEEDRDDKQGNPPGTAAEGGTDGESSSTGAKAAVKKEEEEEDAPPAAPADSNSDSEEEEEESAFARALAARERRKLLASVDRRRGVDAASLLRPRAAVSSSAGDPNGEGQGEGEEDEGKRDLRERLEGTFGAGTGGEGHEEGGILQQKHKRAMEEFIRSKMTREEEGGDDKSSKSGGSNNKQSRKKSGPPSSETKGTLHDAEDRLYADLLREQGAPPAEEEEGEAAPAPKIDAEKEGDVGAGGAMLGGTGIAEVALPVEERLRTVRETELAAARKEAQRRARLGGGPDLPFAGDAGTGTRGGGAGGRKLDPAAVAELPMAFGSGPAKKKLRRDRAALRGEDPAAIEREEAERRARLAAAAPSAAEGGAGFAPPSASSAGAGVLRTDVDGLGSSYSHNFRLHQHRWVSDRKAEREAEMDLERRKREEEEGPVANRERVGFDAARKLARGEEVPEAGGEREGGQGRGGGGRREPGQQQPSDLRVYRSFVSREKARGFR